MLTRSLGWLVVLTCLLAGPAARAEQPVELSLTTNVVEGQGQVGVTIIANVYLEKASLTVAGPFKSRTFGQGAMAPGDSVFVPLPQKPGTARYTGRFTVVFQGGEEASMPLDFSLTVLAGLKLSVQEGSYREDTHGFILVGSRPLTRVTYTVISDEGDTLEEGERLFDAPRTAQPVQWKASDKTIIRIDITAFDTDNTFGKLTLSPWHVDVEHEEVNFPSGSADIGSGEAPKLDRAYDRIREYLVRYGSLVKMNLYIVGYTDTVGATAYNRDLSLRRARSIAAYMRGKGLDFPIYYQGFGEEVLAVPTADNTDELRNRRALYLLGGDYKPTGAQIPRADWKPLD